MLRRRRQKDQDGHPRIQGSATGEDLREISPKGIPNANQVHPQPIRPRRFGGVGSSGACRRARRRLQHQRRRHSGHRLPLPRYLADRQALRRPGHLHAQPRIRFLRHRLGAPRSTIMSPRAAIRRSTSSSAMPRRSRAASRSTAGVLYYYYPGSGGGNSDFFEPYLAVSKTIGPVTAKVTGNYAWKQAAIGLVDGAGDFHKEDNFYLAGDLSAAIGDSGFSVTGHLAHSFGPSYLTIGKGYTDWNLGAAYTTGPPDDRRAICRHRRHVHHAERPRCQQGGAWSDRSASPSDPAAAGIARRFEALESTRASSRVRGGPVCLCRLRFSTISGRHTHWTR